MDTHNTYNYTVVRQFALMTILWGIIGTDIGVWIASELAYPSLNLGAPWLSFGRLRPLHTNIAIFAFGGSALFATSYYVVQRTCHTRLFSDKLASFTFWGWQLVMVLALLTLPLGMTSGRAYAELEWPIDILLALVWGAYAIVFFGTLLQRSTPHIYVANWFFGAYILAVALLELFASAALPVSLWPMKSYSVYPGAVDAMVTWWYGHGLIGSFLTAAFFGALYYFLPRQIGRPLYSYRLAIVQFWATVSLALWSGPQHLLYTALPDWLQSLGMVFALLLLVPFSGGVVNGFMTMSGEWHRLRTDPVLRFFIAALLFYGLSIVEGSVMAIKSINALTHYTDWTVGHAHAGGLGWIGFLTIGALYAMLPRLLRCEQMYSTRLIDTHFWLATTGVVLYLLAMAAAGVVQSTMWYAENDDGTLTYRFIESVQATHYLYVVRAFGGFLYLIGMVVMAYNAWKTVVGSMPVTTSAASHHTHAPANPSIGAGHSAETHHPSDAHHADPHHTNPHHTATRDSHGDMRRHP